MRCLAPFAFILAATLYASPASAQNAVIRWNEIAANAIVTQGGKPSTASGVWFAYAQIAVYDAINAIDHRFEPFYFRGDAPRGASGEAAAIAAAHRVLVHYFPAQVVVLDQQFADSLIALTVSDASKSDGVAIGEAAAAALVAARTGDGLEANVPYSPSPGLGFWQPTPPRFLPALTPWLGQMRPFTMTTASQFLPKGPTRLDSRRWEHDYDQVRALGSATSTTRTPAQTEIGLFSTEHTGQQYGRAFRGLAAANDLDLSDSARMMAILWTGYADSVIGCFNAKYIYSFWRPVTAITAGGGNPHLTADPNWTALGTTPNHPEYPAAHGCVTGTVSSLIADFFHTTKVHFVVDSQVTHTVHTFEDTRDLFAEVFGARIYAGFHYSHSLVDGGVLGRRIARQLFDRHFRTRHREDHEDER